MNFRLAEISLVLILITNIYSESVSKRMIPEWISFNLGIGIGSIVAANKIDGVTAATKIAAGGSLYSKWITKGKNAIQTGIDICKIHQKLTYSDPEMGINGSRDLLLFVTSIPFLYMFHFKKESKESKLPLIGLGIGPFVQIINKVNIRGKGTLDELDIKKVALGIFCRLENRIINPSEKVSLGVFTDFYRGMFPQNYSDRYFDKCKGAGNIGILKVGLIAHLRASPDF